LSATPLSTNIFLAGAGGVIGRRLVPLLLARGHKVFGTTRSPARAAELERDGVVPLILDAFDRAAVAKAVALTRPEVVIHQLTDLSTGFAPGQVAETLTRNTRIRTEGTRNLVDAARGAGVRRFIAQSIIWVYAASPEPHDESDPLDVASTGTRAVTVRGVAALEGAVLERSPPLGVVLRYGWFYGPGANEEPAGTPGVHVDAAAYAAALAVERGSSGVYNVAEDSAYALVEKAKRELGWSADFRQADETS
jgi:nucleoside-diphosphate-sugar epimerase